MTSTNNPFDKHLAPASTAASSEPAVAAAPAPHARRFLLAFLGLAVITGAAIAGTFAIVNRASTPPWSSWRPSSSDLAADEIASHVSPRYRLNNGTQVALIKAGFPVSAADGSVVPPIPVSLRGSSGSGSQSLEVIADATKTVYYQVCGLGANCLLSGKPSGERAALLHRQAVEIALYTFRYGEDPDAVVLILPDAKDPATVPPSPRTQAIVFTRKEVSGLLDRPLAVTVPQVPQRPRALSVADQNRIAQLLRNRIYRWETRRTPDGYPYLLLTGDSAG